MPKPDAFNEELESFENYRERLDAYIVVEDIPAEKHASLLLSLIGAKTYSRLKSLATPNRPANLTYDELCLLLNRHFNPRPLEIMERYRFHQRNQNDSETISDYIAELKRLATTCNFGQFFDQSLRDRLVCGLKCEHTRRRLLQEENLDFDRASSIATSMETINKNTEQLLTANNSIMNDEINVVSKETIKGTEFRSIKNRSYPPCSSCGLSNHPSVRCWHKNAVCRNCSKRGHTSANCKYPRVRKTQELKNVDTNSNYELFNMDGPGKILLPININEKDVIMELDTGAATALMTLKDFREIFHHEPDLKKTDLTLKTYTNELILPLGKVSVIVRYKDKCLELPLQILKEGNGPILGRNWIHELNILESFYNIQETEPKVLASQIKGDFPQVFGEGIGTIKEIKGELRLKPNTVPKYMRARTVPYAIKTKVEEELDHLTKEGVLVPVKCSKWATPIVPIVKGNGKIRICGDYKTTVNPNLVVEQYTLPRIEDMLAKLEMGERFTKIDLRQAYLQLTLDEESKQLTTINTHKGLYQYNRLVYGITSAPAIWQKTMDQILQGLPGIVCNMDDMLITGKTDEIHLKNLRNVLTRLQEFGLKANLDKCSFFKDSVIFCGIKISKEGFHKTQDKIEAVLDAPIPTDKTQVRSFLGLVNFYHKWLPNIAEISKPLYDLLKDETPFQWSITQDTAFTRIKEMVTSDKVLIQYNQDLPIHLACDASPHGIGSVLSHVINGEERPIAYASRTLNKAETNYSQLDKEALAIVWSVKKFFNYLYGNKFVLITDHKPLKFIFGPKNGIPPMSAARLQRYALFLSSFDYNIEFRTGKTNLNADSLSRLPLALSSKDNDEEGDTLFYKEIVEKCPISATGIAKESRTDPILSRVIFYVQNGWPNRVPEELKTFHQKQHELSVLNDCLLWGSRVVIPGKLRKKVLQELHEGHLGIAKMKAMARGIFWWPNLDKEIEAGVKSCMMCSLTQPDPLKAPLHPWQWPEKSWQRIHIDYAGPFQGSMFLVAVDAHSKWVEIIPTASSTTAKTIDVLMTMFARYGIPEQLVSDNATTFTSDEFNAFISQNGIKHIKSAPYHPATNGLAERMVQTFKAAMKSAQNDNGTIHNKLAKFLIAYRNAPHSTTGQTPANLMFGRKLRTKLDMLIPSIRNKILTRQNAQVSSHSDANPVTYEIGDAVLARDYRGNNPWRRAIISAKQGSRTYTVDVGSGNSWKRHADQLVPTTIPSERFETTAPIFLPPNLGTSAEQAETAVTTSQNSTPAPLPTTPASIPSSSTQPTTQSPSGQPTDSVVTRSGRLSKRPGHLKDYIS